MQAGNRHSGHRRDGAPRALCTDSNHGAGKAGSRRSRQPIPRPGRPAATLHNEMAGAGSRRPGRYAWASPRAANKVLIAPRPVGAPTVGCHLQRNDKVDLIRTGDNEVQAAECRPGSSEKVPAPPTESDGYRLEATSGLRRTVMASGTSNCLTVTSVPKKSARAHLRRRNA